jgi:hypothetical protein
MRVFSNDLVSFPRTNCHSSESWNPGEGGCLDADSIGMTLLNNIVETLPLTGATPWLIIAENKYGVNKFY